MNTIMENTSSLFENQIRKLKWNMFETTLTLKVPVTAIDALQHFETG